MPRPGAATKTGAVVGTPYYMSPEQIVGDKEIDARTDIWSLGVVAFEAMTGKRPFEGATVGAITLAIHTSRPRMTDVVPRFPRALDAWFARACAREPAMRFESVREASEAFSRASNGRLRATGASCLACGPRRDAVAVAARARRDLALVDARAAASRKPNELRRGRRLR